jgi:hypothetical protein
MKTKRKLVFKILKFIRLQENLQKLKLKLEEERKSKQHNQEDEFLLSNK